MAKFTPCQGKTACRDDGVKCLTCGRSLEEIVELRTLMDQLAALAVRYDYENVEEFGAYVARKLVKKVNH